MNAEFRRFLPTLSLVLGLAAPIGALAEDGPCDPNARATFDDGPLVSRCERLRRFVRRQHLDVEPLATAVLDHRISPRSAQPGEEAAPLRVATLNAGLLYVSKRYNVPQGEVRREWIADVIRGGFDGLDVPDVLLLQEVYRDEDRALFAEAAEAAGYHAVDTQASERHRTGLMILVGGRATATEQTGFHPLKNDAFAMAGYVRGVQWVKVKTEAGQDVVVGNTHLSPTTVANLSWRRTQQVVELAEAIQSHRGPFRCLASDDCAVVMGGDFNLAPSWTWEDEPAFDTWSPKRQRAYERWLYWDQALYDMLLEVADDEADPHGQLGPSLDPTNPVWEEYILAGGQPTRRVDHVFVVGGDVTRSSIAFDAPARDDGMKLSDHYGVSADISLNKGGSYDAGPAAD